MILLRALLTSAVFACEPMIIGGCLLETSLTHMLSGQLAAGWPMAWLGHMSNLGYGHMVVRLWSKEEGCSKVLEVRLELETVSSFLFCPSRQVTDQPRFKRWNTLCVSSRETAKSHCTVCIQRGVEKSRAIFFCNQSTTCDWGIKRESLRIGSLPLQSICLDSDRKTSQTCSPLPFLCIVLLGLSRLL